MRKTMRVVLCACAAMTASAVSVQAAQQPSYLKGRSEREVKSGDPVRAVRSVRYHLAPAGAQPAWRLFQAEVGGSWRALWDLDTEVPLRVYGGGISTPGALASAAVAETYARQ